MQPPSSLSLSPYLPPETPGVDPAPPAENVAQPSPNPNAGDTPNVGNTITETIDAPDYSALLATDPLAAIQAISQQVAETVAGTIAEQVAQTVATQAVENAIESTFTEHMSLQLSTMRDEAELNGHLRVFRKEHPDAVPFEPFIMQEVARLIDADDDGVLAPWDELLATAYTNFQATFKDTLKQLDTAPAKAPTSGGAVTTEASPPHMEGSTQRNMPQALPTYTRKQIARMTPAEFTKHEAAIEAALKHGRIRP